MRDTGSSLYRLKQLRYWLTLGCSSILLLLTAVFFPLALVLKCLMGAVAILVPYMMMVLYQEKRYGWILGFAALAGIEVYLFLLPTQETLYRTVVVMFLPLLILYGYCWALRSAVCRWIAERRRERSKLERIHSDQDTT